MTLHVLESFWSEHFEVILQHGYRLGPRYDPSRKSPLKPQDEWRTTNLAGKTNVAIRLNDGLQVVLKRVGPEELGVVRHLQSLPKDPRNHTIPILGEIHLEDSTAVLIVMQCFGPFHSSPDFQSFGEVLQALHEAMTGLDFMHEHKIAHRDVCLPNFVEDKHELVPHGAHFAYPFLAPDGKRPIKAKSRYHVQVAYYLIDFEFSLVNPPTDVTGSVGQNITAPELNGPRSYDPFKLDIYCFGDMIQSRLLPTLPALEWTPLMPLVRAMTHIDPLQRPGSTEVVETLRQLREAHPIEPPAARRRCSIFRVLRRFFGGL
ncbi:hypothetical protein C8R46DRAFT_1069241 [Mycena filopes]|nr:hypothetical protein C8R46DRAFT_1069241 [Mycena filopes]